MCAGVDPGDVERLKATANTVIQAYMKVEEQLKVFRLMLLGAVINNRGPISMPLLAIKSVREDDSVQFKKSADGRMYQIVLVPAEKPPLSPGLSNGGTEPAPKIVLTDGAK